MPRKTAVAAYLAEIGRKGGTARSDRKVAAARKNGKKGGRPAKPKDKKERTK